jgi:flagellar basal-body rod protein FlgB
MSLFDTTQIALERALSGASLRQDALANNLANVNTPGYQRQDVDFHDALRGALGAGDPSAAQFAVTTDASAPVRADGGTVDADVESATLAKNGLEYETLATVAKARLGILEAAIGTGR